MSVSSAASRDEEEKMNVLPGDIPTSTGETPAPAGGLNDDVEMVLFTEEVIKERVKVIGAFLSEEYKDKNPLLVGVLTGAFVFVSDLARAMTVETQVDFIAASSYGAKTKSSGSVRLVKDMSLDPRKRHVIIAEDVVDSGLTLNTLAKMFAARGAASVAFVSLFDKNARREHPIPKMKAIGFACPDKFIVGYGIDYAQRYRNLPYVGYLKPAVYS